MGRGDGGRSFPKTKGDVDTEKASKSYVKKCS
jgi:hypothetical protein